MAFATTFTSLICFVFRFAGRSGGIAEPVPDAQKIIKCLTACLVPRTGDKPLARQMLPSTRRAKPVRTGISDTAERAEKGNAKAVGAVGHATLGYDGNQSAAN